MPAKKTLVSRRIRTRVNEATLAEFADQMKMEQPDKSSEIKARLADIESQMELGGISDQEAKLALLSEFPRQARTVGGKNAAGMKGRNTKQ